MLILGLLLMNDRFGKAKHGSVVRLVAVSTASVYMDEISGSEHCFCIYGLDQI